MTFCCKHLVLPDAWAPVGVMARWTCELVTPLAQGDSYDEKSYGILLKKVIFQAAACCLTYRVSFFKLTLQFSHGKF